MSLIWLKEEHSVYRNDAAYDPDDYMETWLLNKIKQ